MAKIAVAVVILCLVTGEVNAGKKLKVCKQENSLLKQQNDDLLSDVEALNETIDEIRTNSILIKTECPIRECLVNELDDTQYLLGTDLVTWATARVRCHKCGYRLARIESSTEHTFVFKWLERVFAKDCGVKWCRRFWIDGTDQLQDGCWLYTTQPVSSMKNTFSKWTDGEPNNYGGGEGCLEANLDEKGNWNDEKCKALRTYLCERNRIQEGPLPDLEDVFNSGLC